MTKQLNLETIQELLSQKKFVKDMLHKNPEFVKIIAEEIKEKLIKEMTGNKLLTKR